MFFNLKNTPKENEKKEDAQREKGDTRVTHNISFLFAIMPKYEAPLNGQPC